MSQHLAVLPTKKLKNTSHLIINFESPSFAITHAFQFAEQKTCKRNFLKKESFQKMLTYLIIIHVFLIDYKNK